MDTTQRRHIADTIRAARLRKGWTVTEAAERLETGESNWSRWETATAAPRPATLVKIGELLDLGDDWATVSHPSSMVSADDLLERIRAELQQSELRIQRMLAELKGDDSDDGKMGRQRGDGEGVERPSAPRTFAAEE